MTSLHKVGFLTGDYLDFGGVETHLLSIFQMLRENRLECVLISPASGNFIRKAEALGARCISWDVGKPGSMEKIYSLRRIILENRLSLLHIHSPGVAVEGRIAAFLSGVRVVVTVHLQPSDYFAKSTAKQKTKLALYSVFDCVLNYVMTKKIIYVSERAYSRAMAWKYSPGNRSIVIPNGIELPFRTSAERNSRSSLGTSQECIVLCFVGRIEHQKGLDVLLMALSLIQQSILDTLELWVVGAGSAKHEIELLSESLNLQKHIRFLGYQENTKVYLAESDIFVLPSNYEALSISLLDAMAYGLPCVVTDTGENSRLIAHGVNGFVIPIESVRMLSSLLAVLATNPAMRESMGRAARMKAEQFPEGQMLSRVKSVYLTEITGTDDGIKY